MGCTATAVSPSMVSGLVVETVISSSETSGKRNNMFYGATVKASAAKIETNTHGYIYMHVSYK